MSATIFNISYSGGTNVTAVICNGIKTQENPYTGSIEEYGVSGDVCGTLIKKLNQSNFSEMIAKPEIEFYNFLGLHQYSDSEKSEFREYSENYLEYSGNEVDFIGNFSGKEDGKLTDKLNISLLQIWIQYTVSMFLQNKIFSVNDIELDLTSLLDNIKGKVSKYIKNFEYEYTIERDKITVTIYEDFRKPIDSMLFNINYK